MKKVFLIVFIVWVISLVAGIDLNEGLIAYYPFDGDLKDKTGNFGEAYLVGNRINVPALGNPKFVEGVVGQALVFDGKKGVVLGDDIITDYDYSVSFWLKIEAFTQHTTTFFGCYIDEENYFYWLSFVPYGWNNGTLLWARNDRKDIWFDGIPPFNLEKNKWYHVVITVDKGKARLFINGEEVPLKIQINGQPNPNGLVPDVFSVGPGGVFALGVNFWDPPFKGMIDELRIYDIPLSADVVKNLYHRENKQ
ncbi:LamG domain-containing protein [Thermotoga sp.]|uniref:LamG domain-containing protein n=1 Tax=Thermotoga sp. TaxID=28240 RepID=UPI0025F4A4F0|nr:LamG domain-containing protein [Thermotoga sp.]MCD6551951.1 LamG domain-containing protein [Thermotoga sp.]